MQTQLEIIMAHTLSAVTARKTSQDLRLLEQLALEHQPRGFAGSLRRIGASGPAIIAELKKASPSKGVLREVYQPASVARGYEQSGAAAISVLTDEAFFQGSLEHLREVSSAVRIPVLRKDFILDPFQIVEARAAGADAILLIVAAHSDSTLRDLAITANNLELDILCEVHDDVEAQRAIDLGFTTIGVNCRNLKTLAVDPAVHEEIIALLPHTVLRVAESSIRTPADVQRLRAAGYDAFLVGETLMRHADPAEALTELLCASAATGH